RRTPAAHHRVDETPEPSDGDFVGVEPKVAQGCWVSHVQERHRVVAAVVRAAGYERARATALLVRTALGAAPATRLTARRGCAVCSVSGGRVVRAVACRRVAVDRGVSGGTETVRSRQASAAQTTKRRVQFRA